MNPKEPGYELPPFTFRLAQLAVVSHHAIAVMRRARTWVKVAVIVVAVVTIWFQHEQNRRLIQELQATLLEKTRLESLPAEPGPTQSQTATEANKDESVESELLRLRGVAARVARAEAESTELRRELAKLCGQNGGTADSTMQNPDTLSAYLGSPVYPPANIDPRYTKEGLAAGIQLAAQKAGISLKRITIDDTEYPFLTGVVTDPGDWGKLTAQLKGLDGYEFHGSVGDDTSHTLCTVPTRAYPADAVQIITRRMGSRLELFYNAFTAAQN